MPYTLAHMKTLIWIVALLIILSGAYLVLQQGALKSVTVEEGMGTYAYACDNGSTFTMTPFADVSAITLEAGSQGMFTGTVMLAKMGDAAHYETTSGELVVFSGAGEGVQLTVGSETTNCNPVPNPDSPPWNWGDSGEGGGVKQDVVLIVSESIVGKWRSIDDAKFTREFKADGTAVDLYDNKDASGATWKAFTKEAPLSVSFPLEDSAVYIQMTMQGTQGDTLNFKLVKLTPEELELIYMDRGGTLRFRSVQ